MDSLAVVNCESDRVRALILSTDRPLNISQLQIQFVAEQDRLLFRMNADDGSEVRAWFTRRLVQRLWPTLIQASSHQVARAQPAATPQAQHMLLGMRHEANLQTMDFSKPFSPEPSGFPLGEEPVLVTRVDLTPQADGVIKVALKPQSGSGVEMNMTEPLFHGFCRLLQQAGAQAEWGMELKFPSAEVPSAQDGGTRVLN